MKEDATGRIFAKVQAKSDKITEGINKRFPIGPDRVEVSNDEFANRFRRMTPEQRDQLAADMGGVENVLEMLENANPPQT